MASIMKSLMSSLGINIGNVEDYPILGANYFVIIGLSILSFSKISGLHLYSASINGINEGGRYEPYLVEEPRNKLSEMKLEKGYGTVDIMNIVKNAKSMILLIKGDDNSVKGVYYTSCMMIQDIVISDLEASKSSVLIQSLTIAYTNLKEVTAIKAMLSMGLGGVFDVLSSYNNNDAEIAAIQEYSQKLSAQKLLAQQKKAANTPPAENSEISEASQRNSDIQKKQEEELAKSNEEKKRQELETLKNLELS